MSLDPGFHSSLYPLTYLAGSFFAALGCTAILAAVWERRNAYRPIFDPMYLLHHLGRWGHPPERWLAGAATAAVGLSCLLLFSRGLKARAGTLAAAG